MSTTTSKAVVDAIRTRLLGFTPKTGSTLNTLLGGRLYTVQAPDEPVYPYAVLTYTNRVQTDGYGGLREMGDLEILIHARPRGQQWAAETIADTVQQAVLRWANSEANPDGLIFTRHCRRDQVPPMGSPMDRELVVVRVLVPVVVWPRLFTQYVI